MKKIYPLLLILKKLKSKDLSIVLSFISHDGCDLINNVVHNALYNKSVKNRSRLRKKLEADKNILRYLVSKKPSLKSKQKKLSQVGGSIKNILSTFIPVLENFLYKK